MGFAFRLPERYQQEAGSPIDTEWAAFDAESSQAGYISQGMQLLRKTTPLLKITTECFDGHRALVRTYDEAGPRRHRIDIYLPEARLTLFAATPSVREQTLLLAAFHTIRFDGR
jgi:hypothetical protein